MYIYILRHKDLTSYLTNPKAMQYAWIVLTFTFLILTFLLSLPLLLQSTGRIQPMADAQAWTLLMPHWKIDTLARKLVENMSQPFLKKLLLLPFGPFICFNMDLSVVQNTIFPPYYKKQKEQQNWFLGMPYLTHIFQGADVREVERRQNGDSLLHSRARVKTSGTLS